MTDSRAVAIVLAAGAGKRMAATVNKVFLPVAGKPIIAWSLECFERHPEVAEVILVAAASEQDEVRHRVLEPFGFKKVSALVLGGPTRHDSEFNGLTYLADRIDAGAIDLVLIHDAVRPFVTGPMVNRLIGEAHRTGAAIPCVPAASNIVQTLAKGQVSRAPARLWAAQTPQVFAARVVLEAHRQAHRDGFEGSDTSSVVERLGISVAVIEGSYDNIKITTSDDLIRGEQIARARPRFGEGRSLLSAESASA
ncbi:MAG: 2-C-methyl-D-erythritol 4-phosphate cytidylyltransferase [Candidatus Dormibacteraeota bacterium]|nr:2-C-methyl-D-erythritol 4-phosphate cytidylyltransferase [Candidatus Dormibacteraeota bacterium]